MRNFNRGGGKSGGGFNRGFGGKSFGAGKRFGDRDTGRPAMHKAICNQCGAACEVPFRPSGERPVFCSNCFKGQGNAGPRSNKFGAERQQRSHFGDKQMSGKAFCDHCSKQSETAAKDSKEIMEQIKFLNAKLDRLTSMLISDVLVENIEKSRIKKELVVKKVVKEKNKTKVASKKSSAKKKK